VRPVEPPETRWRLPAPELADEDGIVAIGGDLEPGTLLAAYRRGLFPMPYGRRRVAWFSPDPRAIIPLDGLRISRLHRLGWAHSFECYDDGGELVGGLYGVRVERFFAGESMFHTARDASKVALVALVEWLRATEATLLDVQWPTPHLTTLGAIEVRRAQYLDLLGAAVASGRTGVRGSTLRT
jgi:leucyl/phenylalanyl-tRNA---protein transferase